MYTLVKLRIRITVINPCSSPRRFNTPRYCRWRLDALVHQLHLRFNCIRNKDRRRNIGKELQARRDILDELRDVLVVMNIRVRIQLEANLLQALDRQPAKVVSAKCSGKNKKNARNPSERRIQFVQSFI